MIDTRCRAEDHGRFVFFGIVKRILYHLESFFRRSGIKYGNSCEIRKASGILLCLGRDRARIVGRNDDHAAFDADISQRHEGIGSDI